MNPRVEPGRVVLLRRLWGHQEGKRAWIDAKGRLRIKGSPPATVHAKDENDLFRRNA